METDKLESITSVFSKRLGTAVLATSVYDSDIFCYWLFKNGNRLDEHNSCPEYWEPVTAAQKDRVRGDSQVLAGISTAGATADEIDSVLHPRTRRTFAEHTAGELLALMGVPEECAGLSYGDGADPALFGGSSSFRLYSKAGFRLEAEDTELGTPESGHATKSSPGEELVSQAYAGSPVLVRRLLAQGADVNYRDLAGRTALIAACQSISADGDRRLDLVNILLAAGADPNLKDDDNMTAADHLAKHVERGRHVWSQFPLDPRKALAGSPGLPLGLRAKFEQAFATASQEISKRRSEEAAANEKIFALLGFPASAE